MKSTKRRKQMAAKKAAKLARYEQPGRSDYAVKHAEQRRGVFRPTSPFRASRTREEQEENEVTDE